MCAFCVHFVCILCAFCVHFVCIFIRLPSYHAKESNPSMIFILGGDDEDYDQEKNNIQDQDQVKNDMYDEDCISPVHSRIFENEFVFIDEDVFDEPNKCFLYKCNVFVSKIFVFFKNILII